MHPILNIAVRAARAAGDIIVRHLDKVDTLAIEAKSAHDFVTEIDRRCEEEIVHQIQRAHPEHAILGEEGGARGKSSSESLWIIDPLDGTTNFIRGLHHFAVSIAMQYRGQIEHAVIYNPVSQDLYTGSRGKGAWLNNRRIRVSGRRGLEGALLSAKLDFHNHKHDPSEYFRVISPMLPLTGGFRTVGSAALDLAHVASGTYDGFFDAGLKPWDLAAGSLLVTEAGGIVSDFTGGQSWMQQGHIMCASPRVHMRLAQHISPNAKALLAPK